VGVLPKAAPALIRGETRQPSLSTMIPEDLDNTPPLAHLFASYSLAPHWRKAREQQILEARGHPKLGRGSKRTLQAQARDSAASIVRSQFSKRLMKYAEAREICLHYGIPYPGSSLDDIQRLHARAGRRRLPRDRFASRGRGVPFSSSSVSHMY
jgi:hypothetical protein